GLAHLFSAGEKVGRAGNMAYITNPETAIQELARLAYGHLRDGTPVSYTAEEIAAIDHAIQTFGTLYPETVTKMEDRRVDGIQGTIDSSFRDFYASHPELGVDLQGTASVETPLATLSP